MQVPPIVSFRRNKEPLSILGETAIVKFIGELNRIANLFLCHVIEINTRLSLRNFGNRFRVHKVEILPGKFLCSWIRLLLSVFRADELVITVCRRMKQAAQGEAQ